MHSIPQNTITVCVYVCFQHVSSGQAMHEARNGAANTEQMARVVILQARASCPFIWKKMGQGGIWLVTESL